MSPPKESVPVDGEGAGGLPARAALGGPVPDILLLAELERVVQGHGRQQVPGRRHAEPEQGVEIALLVDNDAHVPVPAHAHDPALGCLGRGMRDGDEVYAWVVIGELRERF